MTQTVKQSERMIQRAGRRWLVAQGFEVIKLTTLGRYGTAGWPDLMVIDKAPRLPLFLEIKTESGQVTPLQKQKHNDLRVRGYPVFVVRSLAEIRVIIETWLEFRTGLEE